MYNMYCIQYHACIMYLYFYVCIMHSCIMYFYACKGKAVLYMHVFCMMFACIIYVYLRRLQFDNSYNDNIWLICS